jgi:hypothetical protein
MTIILGDDSFLYVSDLLPFHNIKTLFFLLEKWADHCDVGCNNHNEIYVVDH